MNPSPKFLTLDQVVALHQLQIDQFGGSPGVKDEGLLLSALAQPESGFGEEYFHKDLFEMAAAYLFHLVKNHAFHDGNKRIAALTAAVFLEVNGLTVTAEEDAFEKLVMDAAQSLATKEQIAEFFGAILLRERPTPKEDELNIRFLAVLPIGYQRSFVLTQPSYPFPFSSR